MKSRAFSIALSLAVTALLPSAARAQTESVVGAGGVISAIVSPTVTRPDRPAGQLFFTDMVATTSNAYPTGVTPIAPNFPKRPSLPVLRPDGRSLSDLQGTQASVINDQVHFASADMVASLERASLGVAVSSTTFGSAHATAYLIDKLKFSDLTYDKARNLSTTRFKLSLEGLHYANNLRAPYAYSYIGFTIKTSDGNSFFTGANVLTRFDGSLEFLNYQTLRGQTRVISRNEERNFFTVEMDHFGLNPDLYYSFEMTATAEYGMNAHFGNTAYFEFDLNEGASFQSASGKFHTLARDLDAVPETQTWALMIVGFGLAGSSMRRSKREESASRLGSGTPHKVHAVRACS